MQARANKKLNETQNPFFLYPLKLQLKEEIPAKVIWNSETQSRPLSHIKTEAARKKAKVSE